MPVARRQTLVQLDDHRIAMLDERAASEGKSRSQLIREAVDLLLATGDRAEIDRNIVEGYKRIPPDPIEPWEIQDAIASINEEPW
jgi:metal-responsive CopG/Arc/MetJ family transcriptional regulator